MAGVLPEQYLDLFVKRAVANLATLMGDGSPQVTPVWVDFDGVHIRVNSVRGRLKDRNMKRNPIVAMALNDPENPFRYLEVRGRVVEITEAGASEHIDALAKKYTGVDEYSGREPGEVRVMYKIEPLRVSFMG
jgi:PPOX class probable F420-dependent enzyme